MSRARNIKPGFFDNESLAECDPLARILFAGLWCEADREGRLEDRPKRIKTKILPYDECDVNALLQQLADRGFILRYTVGGVGYIQNVQFKKHQNPHIREAASSLPAPVLQPVDSEGVPENAEQAPGEHRAFTVQGTTGAGTSPADSPFLIPDSPSLIPARAAHADEREGGVVVTDGHGNPLTSIIAELSPAQAATVVTACKALRKMGAPRFHPEDAFLIALAKEDFAAEQIVRCGAEKALRDAGLWNDPDVHPDLFDLMVNGASQQDMGLTQPQYLAVRSAAADVSGAYIAKTLRGRRRDAASPNHSTSNHPRAAARRTPPADNFEGKNYAGTSVDNLSPELRGRVTNQLAG